MSNNEFVMFGVIRGSYYRRGQGDDPRIHTKQRKPFSPQAPLAGERVRPLAAFHAFSVISLQSLASLNAGHRVSLQNVQTVI